MAQYGLEQLIKKLEEIKPEQIQFINSDLNISLRNFYLTLCNHIDRNNDKITKIDIIDELCSLNLCDNFGNDNATIHLKKRIDECYTKFNIIPDKNLLNKINGSSRIRWKNIPEILELCCSYGFIPDIDLYDYYQRNKDCDNDTKKVCGEIIIKYRQKKTIEDSMIKMVQPCHTNNESQLADISNKINNLNKKFDEQNMNTKELEKRIQNLTEKLGIIDDYEMISK